MARNDNSASGTSANNPLTARVYRRTGCAMATFAASVCVSLCVLCLFSVPACAAPDTGWTLTFHDEFHGHALDPARWHASHGPDDNSAHPVQFYTPSAVTVGGGVLCIRTEKNTAHGLPFVSGEIKTRGLFSQKYGRFDVRCRFPSAPGAWSAVYLLPESGAWPPEIDITEWIARDPHTIYLTNHWRGPDTAHRQANCNWTDSTAHWTDWHVYRLEWGPGTVRWYIDGALRGTVTEADSGRGSVSSVPMYLRINTAVGGRFAGPAAVQGWPQEFQVDWVRVYRRVRERGHTP